MLLVPLKLLSFRLYCSIYFVISLAFCFAIFCVTRESMESHKARALMEKYSVQIEFVTEQATEWLYKKIAELYDKVLDNEFIEREISKFNEENDGLSVYWIKQESDLKILDSVNDDVLSRVSIGRSLLQKSFESTESKSILPIAVTVKSSRNAGILLFHVPLAQIQDLIEGILDSDRRMSVAILKENMDVLLAMNLHQKIDLTDASNSRLTDFINLLKGRYTKSTVTKLDNFPISIYYSYSADVDLFLLSGFKGVFFLCSCWFMVSLLAHLFLNSELIKLLRVYKLRNVNQTFYLKEFANLRLHASLFLNKIRSYESEIAKLVDENTKLQDLNKSYAFERIRVNTVLDELTAEKEVLLIDKMILEEKIDYLSRKVERNAE
ncbi:hypothetical protein NHE_0349 [Neorickettsia helminthoeca str. Oregon]|uniref:Uncharacterized protein n=2 Tax=Neorickettsia helminthoeca TaxID=33994 RepID=X5H404_9RICK|nr:hypothetical protein NHE_0349 [Neorickettsia helminthoeca str. Oregon]